MKKLLSLLLVLLMVVSIFAACSGPADTKPQGDQGKTDAAKTDEKKTDSNLDEWGRPKVPSSLPEDLNFGDETVNIYIDSSSPSHWFVEEYTDDLINDSVYDRNIKVEDDLGVKLNYIVSDANASTKFAEEVDAIVSAGTNDYDIVSGYAYFLTSAVRSFTYANLLDMPNLYLENPWWNQSYIEEATLAGQLYTVTGDISLSTTSSAGCLFFNKRLADEEFSALGGSDHIYQLVLDGKWTIDAFTDLVKDKYREVDGDGVPSEGDFYGFGSWMSGPIPADSFQFGMDVVLSRDNAEGVPEMVFNSEHTVNALHKLYVLFVDSEGVLFDNDKYYNNGEANQMMLTKFINGEMIFYASTLGGANAFLDMKDDFGLLPMPKFDEKQEKYKTSQADGYSAIAIPAGIEVSERAEMVGATLEKLCEENYRTVNPNYFEVVMKYRYIRSDDEEDFDLKMYDIILEGNGFNFGLIFSSALENPSFAFRHILGRDGSENFASYWSQKETNVNLKFKGLVNWFLDI